jgi:glycine cleavage system aminomethyltransferase T
MSITNLEQKIDTFGNAARMLRGAPAGGYAFPMEPEYTNWRDEQRAWRTTAVLFDQSHHMIDVYFKGPDALRLLSDLGVNSFRNFGKNKAKQFVACNYDGYVIGDAILFGLDDDEFSLVGTPPAPDWVAFHAETGGYDVEVTRDMPTVFNPDGRLTFRYQIQGPNALKIVEQAAAGTLGTIKFFNIGEFSIAGHPVRALNHTMSGVPGVEKTGLEIWGPAEYGPAVLDKLLEAGNDHGLRRGGALSYVSTLYEGGWIPSPCPAIYSGDRMKPYREWLSTMTFEANASIGGSFVSDDIEDYYQTPWDLGYGHLVKFDHDFLGRAALENLVARPHRQKVWLRWDTSDVQRAIIASSLFDGERGAQFLGLPNTNYSTLPFDKVAIGERTVGLSSYAGYTVNIGGFCSLGMVDAEVAQDGTEVNVVWGHGGDIPKPLVEPHAQVNIRAVVSTSAPV